MLYALLLRCRKSMPPGKRRSYPEFSPMLQALCHLEEASRTFSGNRLSGVITGARLFDGATSLAVVESSALLFLDFLSGGVFSCSR